MLVTLQNLAFSYGDNLIFSDVNFAVNEGERVGLIGANGEGKTTLIKLICGEYTPESGQILRKNGVRIGYLEQSGGFESQSTVKEEMLKVFSEELAAVEKLNALSSELAGVDYASAEYKRISAQIERLQGFISAAEAYDTEVKINTVLNGRGFEGRYASVIATMSGGEKTRLKLARLLLERPDLLILDEPTNHLDIATLFWLEDYLQTFKGALLIVSHDRYFLDRTVTKIAEIENKKLLAFKGNYSKYKILKSELVTRMQKEWEAQQEERAKLQTYVDRNMVRATTAKSAQSRVKQLEKMEILEKPYTPPAPPSFTFEYDTKPYERVLSITAFDLERGGKRLISAGQLQVMRGDKLALVGANGTGKTSLLREIISGKNRAVEVGRFVKLAVYDQEGANLNPENTVLSELWERHVGLSQTEVRSSLARSGLFEEDMQKNVAALSGGERAKLALCILQCERANFLMLDEPTNHLDLPARESLERALKEFDGTLILVSHDRYFLSAVATRVAEIENGALTVYDCGYDGYADQKRRQKECEAAVRQKPVQKSDSYRSKEERAAEARKKSEAKRIEGEISVLEEEEQTLLSQLCTPEIAADYNEVAKISNRLEEVKKSLDALYKEYGQVL